MNQEGKRSQQAGKKHAQTDKTKTARQEATSLTAIFTRPHFWSKQHRTEIQKKKQFFFFFKETRQKEKKNKTRKQKIKKAVSYSPT